jgi:hypothetical protein
VTVPRLSDYILLVVGMLDCWDVTSRIDPKHGIEPHSRASSAGRRGSGVQSTSLIGWGVSRNWVMSRSRVSTVARLPTRSLGVAIKSTKIILISSFILVEEQRDKVIE